MADPIPFHLQERRIRASGGSLEMVVWPAAVKEGTQFVITNDRGDTVIARGVAKIEHVTVRWEPHKLEEGYFYRVRPVINEDDE